MNDDQPRGVGFGRGVLAVLRGTMHAFGTVLGLFGRALAAVTRRSRRRPKDDTGGD